MAKPTFEIVSAHKISLSDQAHIFNRAFNGYLAGWTKMDDLALARFISVQGADPCYSRFVFAQGKPVGFGYINRTGNVSRLSGMGTVPEARRTGAASWLLERLLDEARMRHDEAMMLEVFEQNEGAVALYERSQFVTLTRLHGWRRISRRSKSKEPSNQLETISPTLASQLPSAWEYPEIPWQISRHAVTKLPVARSFRMDGACVVLGDTTANPIRIHACFSPQRDWTTLRKLLQALIEQFARHEFFAPAIFPEDFGREIFQPLDFLCEPLNQFLMRRDL